METKQQSEKKQLGRNRNYLGGREQERKLKKKKATSDILREKREDIVPMKQEQDTTKT